MGFLKYDSNEGVFGVQCPRCSLETQYPISDARIYTPASGVGLLIACPPCNCGANTVLFTGTGIGSSGGHALNCLAGAIVKGYSHRDEDASVSDLVKQHMSAIEGAYTEANDKMKQQVKQATPITWVSQQGD